MTRALNIWAWQSDLPDIRGFSRSPVCSDGSAASRRSLPRIDRIGNTDWHIAFPYVHLGDLGDKLRSVVVPDSMGGGNLQPGEVENLAIDCHGTDGVFFPNGLVRELGVDAENMHLFDQDWLSIGLMTSGQPRQAAVPSSDGSSMNPQMVPASTIMLVACNTASGRRGSRLLQQLSNRWPGRQVVGFSTTTVFPHLNQTTDLITGEACTAPFGLDSGGHGLTGAEANAWWSSVREGLTSETESSLPYVDQSAPNAKIARDGQITQVPANEAGRHSRVDAPLRGPERGNLARPVLATNSRRTVLG